MNRIIDILTTDLRTLFAELGDGGGSISPSVYDTAQVARLAPGSDSVWPALDWLIDQQHGDGGWGDPAVPMARDLPTLAAVLALHRHANRSETRARVAEGLAFLRRQSGQWRGPLPQDIPIGVEVLLPALLREAAAANLDLPTTPYTDLIALGRRRHELIQRTKPGPGTTPIHSWEGWGQRADPNLFDGAASIGHSPAATAAWLAAAGPEHEEYRVLARRYLEQASASTSLGIPGVVPTVWPIARFELLFGPYALMVCGLLTEPSLMEIAAPLVADTAAALRPHGYSFSDFFDPDGDDTAAALALTSRWGLDTNMSILRRYERDTHFCTWPHELQMSLSATARAIYTLAHAGEGATHHIDNLIACQGADGRWRGDKWNTSWLYTTSHAVLALDTASNSTEALALALDAILAHQHTDGGWGAGGVSNPTETSYAVIALRAIDVYNDALLGRAAPALARAAHFLRSEYRPFNPGSAPVWIGKEMYRPYRVDRAFELCATLALTLDEIR